MRNQPAVGFDIDGTITYDNGPDNIWDTEIAAYFGVTRKNPSYDFTEAFGLTPDDIERFYLNRVPEIYKTVPIQKGCHEVVEDLRNEGIRVYLITARHREHEGITSDYLRRNGISHDGLFFCEKKTAICKELDIRFFVDDKSETCISMAECGIPCVMVNAFHNLHVQYSPRAYNWEEIRAYAWKVLGLTAKNDSLAV